MLKGCEQLIRGGRIKAQSDADTARQRQQVITAEHLDEPL
jgi:hypothetical protein